MKAFMTFSQAFRGEESAAETRPVQLACLQALQTRQIIFVGMLIAAIFVAFIIRFQWKFFFFLLPCSLSLGSNN